MAKVTLYKAIHENVKDSGRKGYLNSEFQGKYEEHFLWEHFVENAFSHISHGDRKKDYWISTTRDINKAIEYLNDKRYMFNGIAIIKLDIEIGKIYDFNLKEHGFISKDENDILISNNDGVMASVDMADPYTISYLNSCLFLKGIKPNCSFRPVNYACKSDEVLLMGKNIEYEFIPMEEVYKIEKEGINYEESYYKDLYDALYNYEYNTLNDYHERITYYYRNLVHNSDDKYMLNILEITGYLSAYILPMHQYTKSSIENIIGLNKRDRIKLNYLELKDKHKSTFGDISLYTYYNGEFYGYFRGGAIENKRDH